MAKHSNYVVVTPVRDEVHHIRHTIVSMTSQTHLPLRWIVVDDGSTDGTAELLDECSQRFPWMTVVHRNDRGHRAAGSGVMEAFYTGFALIKEKWNFLVKLDGDLSFESDYFERCLERFIVDQSIGIGGGTVCRVERGRVRVDSPGDPAFHVRGATKIYRRACWDGIAPLVRAPGWDTIDEMKANRLGWTTRTFSDLELIQHKPTGAAAGSWSDAFKNGRANYLTGYHAAFMLAKCAKRAVRRPFLVASAALLAGYSSGYLRRIPQCADPKTIRYVRQQQLRRLTFQSSIYR